jgi:rubrerythrin
MNIYEYAMQMEKDGEDFYRDLAGRVDNKGLKNILTMLADAEVIHYTIFKKMKDNVKVKVADTPILSKVKNVFVQMKEENETAGASPSQIELYRKAQGIEKKSRDFYLEKAAEQKDQGQKEIFLKIAEEERKHYEILAKLIDFVSRPQTWLEDAEWYHMEEY